MNSYVTKNPCLSSAPKSNQHPSYHPIHQTLHLPINPPLPQQTYQIQTCYCVHRFQVVKWCQCQLRCNHRLIICSIVKNITHWMVTIYKIIREELLRILCFRRLLKNFRICFDLFIFFMYFCYLNLIKIAFVTKITNIWRQTSETQDTKLCVM